MIQIRIKRVYDNPEIGDGYRVLVDRLWPRGMKKEYLKYDLWAKNITPSTSLRKWFHEDINGRWDDFVIMYQKELSESSEMATFIEQIKKYPVVTLLFASKEIAHNHARILQGYIENEINHPHKVCK